jgi:hypothetical protein
MYMIREVSRFSSFGERIVRLRVEPQRRPSTWQAMAECTEPSRSALFSCDE